jgi:hypothetical protein
MRHPALANRHKTIELHSDVLRRYLEYPVLTAWLACSPRSGRARLEMRATCFSARATDAPPNSSGYGVAERSPHGASWLLLCEILQRRLDATWPPCGPERVILVGHSPIYKTRDRAWEIDEALYHLAALRFNAGVETGRRVRRRPHVRRASRPVSPKSQHGAHGPSQRGWRFADPSWRLQAPAESGAKAQILSKADDCTVTRITRFCVFGVLVVTVVVTVPRCLEP